MLEYYQLKYKKLLKPINRRNGKTIPEYISYPRCGTPHQYSYDNNGGKGQFQCKVCSQAFNEVNHASKPISLLFPYYNHTLEVKKDRKHFRIHKCTHKKYSYYLGNLKLSTRQTAHALKEVHGIDISHATVSNYALTDAAVIKPFVGSFEYKPSHQLSADETYIKVKGVRHYIWFVMDAVSKSILGYQVSDTRAVGPCILAMRMAFDKFKKFPENLKFVADGYSAYSLAKQQFEIQEDKYFDLVQVIGLTNEDAVSTEHRWFKQVVERLNRTFKTSYRVTCGYGSEDDATYGVALWVAYYNFLRPHKSSNWKVLNEVPELVNDPNMPAKWQLLIHLGQQTILNQQRQTST